MSKEIYRFLGCSGTFKGTTINSLMRGGRVGYCWPVFSPIKPWKRLGNGVLMGKLRLGDNLDLAGLSLVTLEQNLWQTSHDPEMRTLFIERSVLDNLFYWVKDKEIDWHNDTRERNFIRNVRKEELQIASRYEWKETKGIILEMLDEKFIEETILKELTRREWFPGGAQEYLLFQREYIDFLREFWGGSSELKLRKITSATEYLEKIKRGEPIPSERIY